MRDSVSKVHSDEGLSDIKSDKELCRICLQHGDTKLEKRCKCNAKTHDLCLAYWIKTRPKAENKYEMNCEVCHSPYNIDKSIQRLMNDNKDIDRDREISIGITTSDPVNNFTNQSGCHPLCLCSSLFLCTIIPIWLLYYLVIINQNNESTDKYTLGITIYITVGTFVTLVYATYKEIYKNNNS